MEQNGIELLPASPLIVFEHRMRCVASVAFWERFATGETPTLVLVCVQAAACAPYVRRAHPLIHLGSHS